MEHEVINDENQLKLEEDLDAEFDQHNVDVEEILARTQRSFSSRRRNIPLYIAPEFIKRLNAFEEVTAGDTVVFQCKWRAFPTPTIKWYKDDEEVVDDPRYTAENDVTENGVIRLVLNGAKKTDEGAYKCKAENQEGVASTTGYLSVAGDAASEQKTLASQKKQKQKKDKEEKDDDQNSTMRKVQSDSAVSYPPHLRTIVEQKSLEEREAESQEQQPPSPLQDFIDKMQSGRSRGVTWPSRSMGYGRDDDDAYSTGSDTSCDSQDYDRVSFEIQQDQLDDVFDDDRLPTSFTTHEAPSGGTVSTESRTNGGLQQNHALVPEIKISQVPNEASSATDSRKGRHKDVAGPKFDLNRVFDFIDTPWFYLVPITSSMTFIASATEMSPLVLVLLMTLISVIAFHFMSPKEAKT